MKICHFIGLLLIFPLVFIKSQNEEYTINDLSFQDGEEITYIISYDWFIIWTEVGTVSFTVSEEVISDKNVFHLKAKGNTFESWNWLCKVDDLYESWVDTQTLKPYYFNRQVSECGLNFAIQYQFNQNRSVAYSTYQKNDKPVENDTISVNSYTFDVISVLFYARTIDYSKYKENDTITLNVLIDRELFRINVEYLGIETMKAKKIGAIECIKLSIPLLEGTIFHEGDNCLLWITNDKNRIPVYIKTPILIGSVRARLFSVNGNKYPMTAIQKKEK